MTTYLLILILSGVTMALLGAVVYLRNPKSVLSRYFLLLCLSVVVWTIANYLVDYSPDPKINLLSTHISAAAAFNILFWMYLFCSYFNPKRKIIRNGWAVYSLIWVIGVAFSSSELVYTNAIPGQSFTVTVTGVAYPLYLAMLVGIFGISLWKLIAAKRKLLPIERTQINFILLGTAATFGLAIINVGIIPIFIDDWEGVKLTPLLALILVGSISYAIVKHKLFDIRLVVARVTTYALVVLVLSTAYGIIVFKFVNNLIPNIETSTTQQAVYTTVAIFMAFTFQPLKQFFDRVTENVFFKDHYSTNSLLSNLSKTISNTLDLHKLTRSVLEEVVETIHIEKGAIFIQSDNNIQLLAQQNFQDIGKLGLDDLKAFIDLPRILSVDREEGSVPQRMISRGISVVLPFNNKQSLKGIVVLGSKQSGDMYTDQDFEVLEILGPELAVAVENARSYQQVQEFNATLQGEVDKATSQLQDANEQLTKKNKELEQLDHMKDEFISITSHELRTPLTAIRGYLWMAMHSKKKDENYDLYMDRSYQSTERLISVVNDTLDISRIESGRVELTPQATDMVKLVEEVVGELASRATERGQTVKITKIKIPAAWCDPNKIHQVLINIIGNGLKFTPEKGKVTVNFTADSKQITISVTDTGPGISKEGQAKLFQKFSRLEATSAIQGTGLGLYLCKQLVELSGGKIWIESEEDKGATFSFSLPISKEQPSILPTKGKQALLRKYATTT